MAGQSASGEVTTLAAGAVLQNRYRVERLLGGGGMGVVYLARDQRLADRPCAIKEMVDHFIDPQQRIEANEYFAREADTLAQLKHVAIPAITDRFDHQNRHYLVMEYVEGRNLDEELAAQGGEPLLEGLVIDIGRQLCDVLAYLHGLSPPMVYRDMKPSNVMLTTKGRVILVDFGIARLFKASKKATMIGTLGFAPPEQYKGEVDPRSDIYSLGATLHYILTGRDPEKYPPFSFPKIKALRPDVSSNLAGAIDAALAYEMDARPQTIQEFRDMMLYGRGVAHAGAPQVTSKGGTAGLPPLPRAVAQRSYEPVGPERGIVRRISGVVTFLLLLGAAAFSATYIYSDPALQIRLGIKPFVDQLPWRQEELRAKAREKPLKFKRLTLALSTREGSELSKPKAIFTDAQLAENHYLKWDASFSNALAGIEGHSAKVEARFSDPNGLQIASSSSSRFVGANEKAADFAGVALIPDLSSSPKGHYKVAVYADDQLLAEQQFTVTEDYAAKAAERKRKAAEVEAVKIAEEHKRQDERRVAAIEERKRKPLRLVSIEFLNTTKSGTALSGPSISFEVNKLLFVGWQVTFDNQLYNLESDDYRVDAAYIGPDGRTLGSVYDIRTVRRGERRAIFTGRVGNSAGGAFLPGTYTVNFYLSGNYLTQKRFHVLASASPVPLEPSLGAPLPSSGGGTRLSLDSPTVATGSIDGLAGRHDIPMELRLRPQPNGFLHGELVIHETGYGPTQIEGFIRGSSLQFQVPYGSETYYFEGARRSNVISGTFESTPSGRRGTWTTSAN